MSELHNRMPSSASEIKEPSKRYTLFDSADHSEVSTIPVASAKVANFRRSEVERYLGVTPQPMIRNIGYGYPWVVQVVAKKSSELTNVKSDVVTTEVDVLLGHQLGEISLVDMDESCSRLCITEEESAEEFEVLHWALEIRDRAVTG